MEKEKHQKVSLQLKVCPPPKLPTPKSIALAPLSVIGFAVMAISASNAIHVGISQGKWFSSFRPS